MGKLFGLFIAALLFSLTCFSGIADAQKAEYRTAKMTMTHATVGTTAALAIAAASVGSGPMYYQICMDGEATATYLAIGKAADPLTDGVRLKAGQCFTCEYCSSASLKALNVVGQAAGTGYSVVQFLQ